MNSLEHNQLASDLDAAYRRWKGARTIAKTAIQRLLQETVALAAAVALVKGSLKGSFVRWCRLHCRSYDPNDGRAVCAVAEKEPDFTRAETWQLRLLNIITPIHHSVRPMAKRRIKASSWLGSVNAVKDKVRKLITQSGGVEKMDSNTRAVLTRHLDTLDELRKEING